MSKTYAHYTESTKRNIVAAVRSGLNIRGMEKRLSIPESTISQWVHSPRYSDIAPASEEVLTAIPSLPWSRDHAYGFSFMFLCLYGKMNETKCNSGRNDMKTISTLEKINHLLTEQFAIDYGCTVEDFICPQLSIP